MRDRNSVFARLDASRASRAWRSARAVCSPVTSRNTAVSRGPRSVSWRERETSSGNSWPSARRAEQLAHFAAVGVAGLQLLDPGASGEARDWRGMKRLDRAADRFAAGAPNRRSAARLKSTTLPSASIAMTPSLTASTSPVMRTSPWRSAACMCSRSVMSKNVATEPCSAPPSRIGCDQYSTGNELPSRRQRSSPATCSSRGARCAPAMREAAAGTPFGGRWTSASISRPSRSDLPLVAEHGERRPVDEGAAALGVDAVQPLGGGIQQALQRLAAAPHLVLGRRLDPGAVADEGQSGEPERGGEDEVQAEQ